MELQPLHLWIVRDLSLLFSGAIPLVPGTLSPPYRDLSPRVFGFPPPGNFPFAPGFVVAVEPGCPGSSIYLYGETQGKMQSA